MRPSPAFGMGAFGALTANVAPSTRLIMPVVAFTAYAVESCWTASSRSPRLATCTCAATSPDEPSSSESWPTEADGSHAAPDRSLVRSAGYPLGAPNSTNAPPNATIVAALTAYRSLRASAVGAGRRRAAPGRRCQTRGMIGLQYRNP